MPPSRSTIPSPQTQLDLLNSLELSGVCHQGNFQATLAAHDQHSLWRGNLEILQINLGKLCNLACEHCHVDAGPTRTQENMDRRLVDTCLRALDLTAATTVDITGGAPELNPHFRYLVEESVARGKKVIDRCNLTVLLLPGMTDLPAWLGARGVEIVCSLPDFAAVGTDQQRGTGTFAKSITALQALNAAGYGQGDPQRQLVLVSNPVTPQLAKFNPCIEKSWRDTLQSNYGVTFDRLITLNNMPIARYLDYLQTQGELTTYLELLVKSFNPQTISGLMCRNTLSVAWNGKLYDCDFNQMLDLPILNAKGEPLLIQDFEPSQLQRRAIMTNRHCFGCTAGAGSSCSGAIAT
ncbi:arsenosugar biosynthesis radical SAM protein ArsS [Thermosynechococcaceae cyanobacterium BACA0444]|uniref:Arsenosugar biosynthesis radical SAM protein ArsS n=1 Tax=Pseudocalidococcus azoricus BACA0444 TaxID=2918990 RepID=A0AAE4FUE0_9CYAN|nr:arsenosugar biosynthesis radical SAM (seleno)protein ArsS [Pseudocalidococcus azoricus]MDS3861377.1 arsenosugar biosynthesis radical SAM protein ArsS [Pseudocalidococcus azoricus BACA0444]